jgi:hypothetical protein
MELNRENITDLINILKGYYNIKDKLNNTELDKCIALVKTSTSHSSYECFENVVAMMYIHHLYGIPLKSISKNLGYDFNKLFNIMKKLERSVSKEEDYSLKFIKYLSRNESKGFINKLNKNYFNILDKIGGDKALLIISLFSNLKKMSLPRHTPRHNFMLKNNLFGYSDLTVRKKRIEILPMIEE